jgi:spore coat polysaccharide biosynthesis predicted glycosyltransferase SpsG
VFQAELKDRNNILICPLEWGLGHAGRMIPLARKLRDMNNNIFIGSGPEHLSFFESELHGITLIKFKGFKPIYSRFLPQYIILLLQLPLLLYHIFKEHYKLKKIIRDYEIDIVISDNRFGLWNKKVKTVYVTHMPLIPFPAPFTFLEFTGKFLHRLIIKKFNFCFIPDLPGEINLSGRLSHGVKLPDNVRFVGILSRFSYPVFDHDESSEFQPDTTVILSGPEPQKSILQKKLTGILKYQNLSAVILEGKPLEKNRFIISDKIISYNHLPAPGIIELLGKSSDIITRSGYSTIMELVSMNCKALLIPTPGQPEQEYLARYLSQKGWFTTAAQRDLTQEMILSFPEEPGWPDLFNESSNQLLVAALAELLEYQHKKEKT